MAIKIIVYILAAICGYLLGGVNPAIVLSKLIYHRDIRTVGSGNPGFTNFKRSFGGKYAWFVFVLDLLKSAVLCSVFGTAFYFMYDKSFEYFHIGAAYVTLFAMIGHAYPIFYKFKGGKAFLVAAASVWFVDWRVALIAMILYLLLLFITNYMSLSVMIAAVTCPIMHALFNISHENIAILVLTTLSTLFLIYRHKENIVRLVHKEEKKFYIFDKLKKKKEKDN